MNFRHFALFTGWSLLVIALTSVFLFIFTFGDCCDVQVCIRNTNRAFWLISGSAFVIYWAVAISLFRRWSR